MKASSKQQRSTAESPQSRKSAPKRGLQLYLLRHLQASLLSLGQIVRAPISSLMILIVIGIALALPAALFILLHNLQVVSHNWDNSAQISLYLKTDVNEAQIRSLLNQFKQKSEIADARYISPAQGLSEFEQQSGFGNAVSVLANNPLPGVIEIIPSSQLTTPYALNQLLASLRQLPQVDAAQLDMAWVQRLYAMISLGRHIIDVLALLLGLGILLIIGNTIHLATQSHRKEIEVYKLVGATDAFVRRPFLYSGFFYGLLGGLVAWILLQITLFWLRMPTANLAKLYNSNFHLQGLNLHQTSILLLGAAVLGLLGSWLAVNRHLQSL